MKICFDAGHGGKDPGAIGHKNTKEKDNVLAITLIAGKIAEINGFDVIYTRVKDNFISLYKRAVFANDNDADLFVSIHNNSFTNKSAKGIETWSYPGSQKGKELSALVQKEMVNAVGLFDRGIKQGRFTVLRRTNMTSILVETGFISNLKEETLLVTEDYRIKIAEAIVKGICKYVGKQYKLYKDDNNSDLDLRKLVLELQVLLNRHHIGDSTDKKLVEDGIFGPKTKAAIEKMTKYIEE